MPHDALSDLLRSIRLRGATFYYVSCHVPWAAQGPASAELGALMPGAEQVMAYHMVARGEAWACVDGEPPLRLAAGDVVVFPQGDGHLMASDLAVPPQRMPADWLQVTQAAARPIAVSYHAGVDDPRAQLPAEDVDAVLVCGFIGCDRRPFNPLLASLPRMLHLPARDAGSWVGQVIDQAVAESSAPRPGSGAVLERLSEMMFVHAARTHLERLHEASTGWLAGVRDRYVGRALTAVHAQPGRDWTLEDLGREAGLSRSALHERFVQLVGLPPMQYLAQWRMQRAATALRQGHATVATIAQEAGYDSEAAFSRAFKRAMGLPPAAWRRQQQLAADTPS
ncbi:MAG: AraC family transcriptional regulator [Rhizobacter sp.]|nr:AraC family transcriptional regulator [Rhizobacter sp.]